MILGLPDYQITCTHRTHGEVQLGVRYTGPIACPDCDGTQLRSKGWYERQVRHYDLGGRPCRLHVRARKWQCRVCGRQFRERLPGIPPYFRASEGFQRQIYQQHLDGINRSVLARRQQVGAATVDRYFRRCLQRQFGEWHPPECPRLLGIDEHFFSRRHGYATTLCDLKNHKVYDVVLGRSEAALESYLQRLRGREAVQVVCMDLSSTYRALVRKYFPYARIVADRFHVIRLINHHFLACWRDIDPAGAKHRGLLSLMRRHRHNLTPDQQRRLADYFTRWPVLEQIYRFKQSLCYLLLKKHRTRRQCELLAPRLLRAIDQLRQSGLPQLVTLGETLASWQHEIAAMWRFTRNNGITEGFHTKMELISRQAFGFRNFHNYKLRVKVLCC